MCNNPIQKLVFRSCGEKSEMKVPKKLSFSYSDDATKNKRICSHTESERGFVTTVTHIGIHLYIKR